MDNKMADLITNDRARYNLPNSATADNEIINAMIAAASKGIERYCRRSFVQAAHDELYDDRGQNLLQLRQYPISSIEALRADPVGVLRARNTDKTLNQQARISVQKDGLLLVRVASGTKTVDTSVTWTANATVTALVTAIDALGNGWDAEVLDSWGKWPADDLRLPQGALNCRDTWVELKMHTEEWSEYEIDEQRGYLFLRNWTTETDFAAFPVSNNAYDQGAWIRPNYFRVQYTAGFATVPEDVQEACAQWVSLLYHQTMRDPGLVSGASSAEGGFVIQSLHALPPSAARGLLAPWRRYSVMV